MFARTPPTLTALFAAIAIADALSIKRDAVPGAESLPPELQALFKCGDPTCDACHPSTGEKQPTEATQAEAAVKRSSSAIEISSEIAELVGMTKAGFDPESLEGRTRILAAAFIHNVRKLGEQPVGDFPKAGAKFTGLRYVENSILSALHTFSTLATK